MPTSQSIAQEIAVNSTWRNAVERASGWIDNLLGPWRADKQISWRVRDSEKREPQFDLRIESEGCSVADRFDQFEIANETLLKPRILKLWGELNHQTLHQFAVRLKEKAEAWQKETELAASE